MKPINPKVRRALVAALLVAAVAAGVFARSLFSARKSGAAFTVKSRLTTAIYVMDEVKYISATGATRSVQKTADGRSREWVYRPGEGVFTRGEGGEWVRDPRAGGQRDRRAFTFRTRAAP